MRVRIQKFLADAGVASRRAAEQMIVDGRVTVNGQLVMDVPFFVDSEHDDVRVDNRPVRKKAPPRLYFLLNKPRGVICTQRDRSGRPRASDLVPAGTRVYCAGRLDQDSTGLLVLTNDGELTQRITHPRYGVPKTYVVEIEGRLSEDEVRKLKRGVYLDGRRTQGARVKVLRRSQQWSVLELELSEGRNREIRRMLAGLGHKVRRLKRTAIGPITDRGLKIGHWRPLTRHEVDRLMRASQALPAGPARGPSVRRGS